MESKPSGHFVYEEESLKEDNIEGKVLSFDDPEQNKSTKIKINKVNRILGNGSYSKWVAEVNIGIEGDTSTEKKTHNMVVKRYREGNTVNAVRNYLKLSYINYRILKRIGVPTWVTYRINEQHRLALMTLGEKENGILLTTNDFDNIIKERQFAENPVLKIENEGEFIAKVLLILEKLDTHGYKLHPDSYGVIFTPQQNSPGTYRIDIIVSDLDNLNDSKNPIFIEHYGEDLKKRWREENKHNLGTALFGVFPGNRTQKSRFEKSIISKL